MKSVKNQFSSLTSASISVLLWVMAQYHALHELGYSQMSVFPFLLSLHNWFCPLFCFFWYTYWKEEVQRDCFKAKWNSAVFSFLCFLVFSQCPSLSEWLAQQTSLAYFSSPLCMGSPDCCSIDTPIKSCNRVIYLHLIIALHFFFRLGIQQSLASYYWKNWNIFRMHGLLKEKPQNSKRN